MPLTASALSETNLEGTLLALFAEWLAGFFDGAAHDIGGNTAVTFPVAQLRFQQAALDQPLNGTGISLVWDGKSEVSWRWETVSGGRQQMAYAQTSFIFWVRVANTSAASANDKKQAQIASDRLFAILQNSSATKALAQRGIHRLRPNPPRPVADTNYQLRYVVCQAQLRYAVLSQVNQ